MSEEVQPHPLAEVARNMREATDAVGEAFAAFGLAWDQATYRDHLARATARAERGDPRGKRWLKELIERGR